MVTAVPGRMISMLVAELSVVSLLDCWLSVGLDKDWFEELFSRIGVVVVTSSDPLW